MLLLHPLPGLCFRFPGMELPSLLHFACLKSSQFLRLNSRAHSSKKPCVEKAVLYTPWPLLTAVIVIGSVSLIMVSVWS